MDERSPQLRILGISAIVDPLDMDPLLGENAFIQVAAGRGSRDIHFRARLPAKVGETLTFSIQQCVVP